MMSTVHRIGIAIFLMFISATAVWADKFDETRHIFESAGISEMFKTAYGYALFPTIGKGGFVVGGAYGEGRVYEQGNYVGDTQMIQGTIGFQLGGTGFSQVVFFEDQRAFAEFVSGNFEFGAEAQATVLTAAAKASLNTGGSSATASGTKNNAAICSTGYNKGMATFTITKAGLMYEASLGGQKFNFTRR
jgi:lipid-binding SYLF domain-containing protein